jgi:hypothetical protein
MFSILLAVALLVAFLLIAIVGSFDGSELTNAEDLGGIGITMESANISIEAAQLPRPGSAPVKLCSVNWED